ncbi:hypothetical protein CALCODRAFT_484908 [Calocera cornea HHB12733]|uniref:DNA-directed RNA polymerase III subunit RPC9 n=1 Tax=Calocera cornea HHB12733 TaxID=1353952 RepID=A0A165ENY9_9BASI|nr:hypothetical protein CALCODRAFT_484908 [Calocera cornea HHB12733]
MEVVNARTAFLSNYEVLSLVQELDSDALAQGTYGDMPANQRAIQNDLRTYLTSKHVDACDQTAGSVQHLARGLAGFGLRLTRTEKLQICNQMPTELVVLYTIIENFEDRLSDESASQILALVRESQAQAASELATLRPAPSPSPAKDGPADEKQGNGKEQEEQLFLPEEEAEPDPWAEEFDAPEEVDVEIDEVEE